MAAGSMSPRSLGPLDSFDAVVQAGDPNHPDHQLWRRRYGAMAGTSGHGHGHNHSSRHSTHSMYNNSHSPNYRSSSPQPPSTPTAAAAAAAAPSGVVQSRVAEYEEVAKRSDEARSLSRRASASSLGGRRSSFSHVNHVHGTRGEGKGGSADAPRSSSDRDRDRDSDVYRRDFLDDPKHPESFQAQQLSIDPILLHGALENVSTMSAGENARKTRKGRRAVAEGGAASMGHQHAASGSAASNGAGPAGGSATRANSGRKSASRRTSANPLRASATSIGHSSSSRHRASALAGGPTPVPPPRVTSSLGFGLANPGFVPETIAELNAAAQAAAETSGLRPGSKSSTDGRSPSGATAFGSPAAGPSSNRKSGSRGGSRGEGGVGSSSGATRRASARSLRSDVSHATATSITGRVHSLQLPPMPEVLPPRNSSMLPQNLDGSPTASPPLPLPFAQSTPQRLSFAGRTKSQELRSPSLAQVVQRVADLSFGEPASPPPQPQQRLLTTPAELTSPSSERRRQQDERRQADASLEGERQPSRSDHAEGLTAEADSSRDTSRVPDVQHEEEEQEEIRPDDGHSPNFRRPRSGSGSGAGSYGGVGSYSHFLQSISQQNQSQLQQQQHYPSLPRMSTDESTHSGWAGSADAQAVLMPRARRGTVGSQRGSVTVSSGGAQGAAGAAVTGTSMDPSSAGRPSFSSMRSSVWPHGIEGDLLPSAASHGHGSRVVSGSGFAGSGSGNGTGTGSASTNLRRSASPHSPATAGLSPEHSSVRLSYGSSALSSSSRSRNRESMITARSSMSATNGHGLELDGVSAHSHERFSSVGGEHRLSKRSSGVPSVWIGPAKAGDETEEGEEFFDARSDEGDEGDDSGEEQMQPPPRPARRTAATAAVAAIPGDRGRAPSRRERMSVGNKRLSVRSSIISQLSSKNGGTSPSRAPSPAKSAGTENHESDSAAAGHGGSSGHGSPALGTPNTVVNKRTSNGLLLPPVLLSAPSVTEATIAPAPAPTPAPPSPSAPPSSYHHPTLPRRTAPVPPKRRSRTNMLAENPFEEDAETSSNSSNEAANSYAHGLRSGPGSVSRHRGSRQGSRQGHGSRRNSALGHQDRVAEVRSSDTFVQSSAGPASAVRPLDGAPSSRRGSGQRSPAEAITPALDSVDSSTTVDRTDQADLTVTAKSTPTSISTRSLPSLIDMDPQSKSFRAREEIARAKTLRRLAKVEGAAAKRRLIDAEAQAQSLASAQAQVQAQAQGEDQFAMEAEGWRAEELTDPASSAEPESLQTVPIAYASTYGGAERSEGPQVKFEDVLRRSPSAGTKRTLDEADETMETAPRGPSISTIASEPHPASDLQASTSGHADDVPERNPESIAFSPAQPEKPRRKSLDSRLARRFGLTGEGAQRSPDPNLSRRGSRGVEFVDAVVPTDDGSNSGHNVSSLGRKKGLALLFGRSRRKSLAAGSPIPPSASDPTGTTIPMPLPSILTARRPSEPGVRTSALLGPSPEVPPMPSSPRSAVMTASPVPASAPTLAPAAQHGLGFAFQEGPSPILRPETPADGRATPSGRWRSRLTSMSSVRSPMIGRKSDAQAMPMPYSPESGVDEEWRRNLLTDAVGLSLGLATPKTPRSESRSGYRSGDERPVTPGPRRIRRPVTPLPTDNSDPQETIKKSLSTPLLSDDLVDDGDESSKIDTLLMDLDNGLLIDSVPRPERFRAVAQPTPGLQGILMDRSPSSQSDMGMGGVARRTRGSPNLPTAKTLDQVNSGSTSPGAEGVQTRPVGSSTGPRVYSTILEDVPHKSRSETYWNGSTGGGGVGHATADSQTNDGMLSVDAPNQHWPSEGGHDSAYTHSDASRIRLGSQVSLYGAGASASGAQSDAEGMPEHSGTGHAHGASTPNGRAFEAMGRMSKSVDHHHTSAQRMGSTGTHGDLEWMGVASAHGHYPSNGRGGSSGSKSFGVLSGLKARLRGRRQQDVSALGIGNVRMGNSQAVVNMAIGPSSLSYDHGRSLPASAVHGYGGPNSYNSHQQQQQQSFYAAQEATSHLLATERDMDFTPSLSHANLPPESPSGAMRSHFASPSKSTAASSGFNKVSESSSDAALRSSKDDRSNPYLIPPSPTAWSLGSAAEGGPMHNALSTPVTPLSASPSVQQAAAAAAAAANGRTSTSELLAFDQMLRGYSAANSVLVRQIAARASSSNNNHGPTMVSSG
ncbi:hypothetical protein OC844_002316 [Tilletia horrida]|nr:hypothetical protein OC844_002316 [Tilletia horrida]